MKAKTSQSTWTFTDPIITAKQVDAITKNANLRTKVILLFKRSQYSYDPAGKDKGCLIRYKQIGKTCYIKEVRYL